MHKKVYRAIKYVYFAFFTSHRWRVRVLSLSENCRGKKSDLFKNNAAQKPGIFVLFPMTCPLIRKLYSDLTGIWTWMILFVLTWMELACTKTREKVKCHVVIASVFDWMRLKWLKCLKCDSNDLNASPHRRHNRQDPDDHQKHEILHPFLFSVALEQKIFHRCFHGVFSLGYGWIVWLFTVSVLVTRVRIPNGRSKDPIDLLVLNAVENLGLVTWQSKVT